MYSLQGENKMNRQRIVFVSVAAICLTLVCAFVFIGRVEASPAAPIDIPITQPDGKTTFIARQWGDEWNHGFETAEGFSIIQMEDGWWVFAAPQADGLLGPALVENQPLKVGIDKPTGLTQYLRPSEMKFNPNAASVIFADGVTSPEYENIGTEPVLVILGQYTDHPGTVAYANFATEWFGASNSIKDFFLKTSYNNLTLAAATETSGTANDGVVGWLTLGATHPASDSYLSDEETLKIVYDALTLADPYINYASYDTDGNGYIAQWELHIFVIVAGHETSYDGTEAYAVWAHNWSLEYYSLGCPTLDGKILGNGNYNGGYSQVGELHGTHQATMGTMAHELGHDLSNPDLYDTDGSSEGVGEWSVQGSGNWNATGSNYAGTSPAFLDPFLKSYQGWLTPTNVTGTLSNQAILQAETNSVAYRLRPNPGDVDWEFYGSSGTGEYFLVENRQLSGYDAALPGCGLVIWHIDETVTTTNAANADETDPLVAVEQADGNYDLLGNNRGDAGDPYPGSSVNYDFNSGTVPDSHLYSGSSSLASVHVDSTSCSSTMYADLTFTVPPLAFSKTTPANTASGQLFNLTLDWADATYAATYDYCYDKIPNGTCTGTWTEVSGTSQAAVYGLNPNSTYEWQVIASNEAGEMAANSGSFWTFTTFSVTYSDYLYMPMIMDPGPPPADFGKISPVNAATGTALNPTMDWEDSAGATSYDFCYDLTVNGDCTGGWTSTGSTSQITLPTLPYSSTYEWQARAYNLAGYTYADIGTEWSFTTGAAWTIRTTEDFEGTFPKTGWTRLDGDGSTNGTYYTGKRTCNVHNGSYSGWMIGAGTDGAGLSCGAATPLNTFSRLIYGPFSTTGATAGEFNFDLYINGEYYGDYLFDYIFIGVSSDNTNFYGYAMASPASWGRYTLDLSDTLCASGTVSCLGLSNVWVRFSFYSDESVQMADGALVDDLEVRVCLSSACAASPAESLEGPLNADPFQDFLKPLVSQFFRLPVKDRD
jgi:M6 family metalloprotease-like protein